MSTQSNWPTVQANQDHNLLDGRRLFFDSHQWSIIEAATARIIPTDHDPGAREANVIRFIDRYLSGIDYLYATGDGSGFLRPGGDEAEAWRHRIATLQEKYRDGITQIDRISRERFDATFVGLDENAQDTVLATLSGHAKPGEVKLRRKQTSSDQDKGKGGAPPTNQPIADDDLEFFPLLVLHTRQGFYSDPAYGGNHRHVGWQVIGFPGPNSLEESRSGRYTTRDYMLPEVTWPYTR